MTPGTAVSPSNNTLTAPQTIKTFTLDVSDDEYITVSAEFLIQSFAATNIVAQAVPLVLNIGATNTTVNARVPASATNTAGTQAQVVPLWLTATSRNGDTVTAQLGVAGAIDAGTTVNVIGFKVAAESGTRAGT